MTRPNDAPFPGATSKIHMGHSLPGALGYGYIVAVARPPLAPHPDAITAPGAISCILTHDAGCGWTDRTGEAMAAAILKDGGGVLFAFASLGDALACHRRINGGAGK